ncbi:hypothetical protein SNEBB_004752 [Seison nebaliae]|nr:hypothetical protein SNEBB_004752 [Seison nebaliae]
MKIFLFLLLCHLSVTRTQIHKELRNKNSKNQSTIWNNFWDDVNKRSTFSLEKAYSLVKKHLPNLSEAQLEKLFLYLLVDERAFFSHFPHVSSSNRSQENRNFTVANIYRNDSKRLFEIDSTILKKRNFLFRHHHPFIYSMIEHETKQKMFLFERCSGFRFVQKCGEDGTLNDDKCGRSFKHCLTTMTNEYQLIIVDDKLNKKIIRVIGNIMGKNYFSALNTLNDIKLNNDKLFHFYFANVAYYSTIDNYMAPSWGLKSLKTLENDFRDGEEYYLFLAKLYINNWNFKKAQNILDGLVSEINLNLTVFIKRSYNGEIIKFFNNQRIDPESYDTHEILQNFYMKRQIIIWKLLSMPIRPNNLIDIYFDKLLRTGLAIKSLLIELQIVKETKAIKIIEEIRSIINNRKNVNCRYIIHHSFIMLTYLPAKERYFKWFILKLPLRIKSSIVSDFCKNHKIFNKKLFSKFVNRNRIVWKAISKELLLNKSFWLFDVIIDEIDYDDENLHKAKVFRYNVTVVDKVRRMIAPSSYDYEWINNIINKKNTKENLYSSLKINVLDIEMDSYRLHRNIRPKFDEIEIIYYEMMDYEWTLTIIRYLEHIFKSNDIARALSICKNMDYSILSVEYFGRLGSIYEVFGFIDDAHFYYISSLIQLSIKNNHLQQNNIQLEYRTSSSATIVLVKLALLYFQKGHYYSALEICQFYNKISPKKNIFNELLQLIILIRTPHYSLARQKFMEVYSLIQFFPIIKKLKLFQKIVYSLTFLQHGRNRTINNFLPEYEDIKHFVRKWMQVDYLSMNDDKNIFNNYQYNINSKLFTIMNYKIIPEDDSMSEGIIFNNNHIYQWKDIKVYFENYQEHLLRYVINQNNEKFNSRRLVSLIQDKMKQFSNIRNKKKKSHNLSQMNCGLILVGNKVQLLQSSTLPFYHFANNFFEWKDVKQFSKESNLKFVEEQLQLITEQRLRNIRKSIALGAAEMHIIHILVNNLFELRDKDNEFSFLYINVRQQYLRFKFIGWNYLNNLVANFLRIVMPEEPIFYILPLLYDGKTIKKKTVIYSEQYYAKYITHKNINGTYTERVIKHISAIINVASTVCFIDKRYQISSAKKNFGKNSTDIETFLKNMNQKEQNHEDIWIEREILEYIIVQRLKLTNQLNSDNIRRLKMYKMSMTKKNFTKFYRSKLEMIGSYLTKRNISYSNEIYFDKINDFWKEQFYVSRSNLQIIKNDFSHEKLYELFVTYFDMRTTNRLSTLFNIQLLSWNYLRSLFTLEDIADAIDHNIICENNFTLKHTKLVNYENCRSHSMPPIPINELYLAKYKSHMELFLACFTVNNQTERMMDDNMRNFYIPFNTTFEMNRIDDKITIYLQHEYGLNHFAVIETEINVAFVDTYSVLQKYLIYQQSIKLVKYGKEFFKETSNMETSNIEKFLLATQYLQMDFEICDFSMINQKNSNLKGEWGIIFDACLSNLKSQISTTIIHCKNSIVIFFYYLLYAQFYGKESVQIALVVVDALFRVLHFDATYPQLVDWYLEAILSYSPLYFAKQFFYVVNLEKRNPSNDRTISVLPDQHNLFNLSKHDVPFCWNQNEKMECLFLNNKYDLSFGINRTFELRFANIVKKTTNVKDFIDMIENIVRTPNKKC